MGLPFTDDKKYFGKLIASMTKSVSSIDKQMKDFAKIDESNLPNGSKYSNNYDELKADELFEEIKRAAAEFITFTDDNDNLVSYYEDEHDKFIIKQAEVFAAILTPALLRYFNTKMDKVYTEIYKSIQKEIEKIKSQLQ